MAWTTVTSKEELAMQHRRFDPRRYSARHLNIRSASSLRSFRPSQSSSLLSSRQLIEATTLTLTNSRPRSRSFFRSNLDGGSVSASSMRSHSTSKNRQLYSTGLSDFLSKVRSGEGLARGAKRWRAVNTTPF